MTDRELRELLGMEARDDLEDPVAERDREMLENLHLHFEHFPGKPRSWAEMSEEGRESIRRLYWSRMEGSTDAG